MNIRVETWMGHKIRFVEVEPDDWWAVAKDVAEALNYRHTPHMLRMIDADEKNTVRLKDSNKRGNPLSTVISETGIYEAVFNSEKDEVKEFKKWVKQVLREIRKSTGLEGFQIFRMVDKEHQKEAMQTLKKGMKEPVRVDFIKANTIANKATSSMFGHPKMIKKDQMTPDMLVQRQEVLDDTVNLMAMADKFKLNLSVSDTVYGKYLEDRQRNRTAN